MPRQHTGVRTIRVLLIPARDDQACRVVKAKYSAAGLSDTLGGGLLDDLYYGAIDPRHDPHGAGIRYCIYADQERTAKELPVNPRAEILAARLGCIGDLLSIPLSGDILITGATRTHDDADVPDDVLSAAQLAGLLPPGSSRKPRTDARQSSRPRLHE